MQANLQRIEFAGPGTESWPQWQRSLLVARDGKVFMPAAIAGNESSVVACAGFDGISAATYHKHFFLPIDWLAREYPQVADVCAKAELAARNAIDTLGEPK